MRSVTALREPQMPVLQLLGRPVSTPLVKTGLIKRCRLLQAHPQALRAWPAVREAPELPMVLELLMLLMLRASKEGRSSG